jgi:DNA-binding NarL/FixJ family response regulator
MIPILLIDDHQMVASALAAWLKADGRFSIAATAATLAEARSLMEKLDPLPKIIILDISLGKEDGLTLIPELKTLCEKRKAPFQEGNLRPTGSVGVPGILVWSMHEDHFMIQRAMELGAAAYVTKSAKPEEFLAAIEAILKGVPYVNTEFKRRKERQQDGFGLTSRENEIAALVKQSLTTPQIAKRLDISARTVEKHLERIYVKTETSSWEELHNL